MSDNKFYYKVPDKPLYNIQEQVYVNQYNIEENRRLIDLHYETDRVIGELGIRIIGQRDTFEEIADTIPEQFGDAYAIGTQPPYDIYVWTRTSDSTPVNEGEWFDIGPIAIQGEPGPVPIIENDGTYITSTNPETGDTTNIIAISELKGAPGTSSRWYASINPPYNPENYNLGDQWLDTHTGDTYGVFEYVNGQKYWHKTGNIKGPAGATGSQGPQGPQGPAGPAGEKGPQGDVGGFINIWGILSSPTSLPSPSTINNLTVAYLVGSSTPYDLYVQVGENSTTARWFNAGPFNAATLVTVSGVGQNVWDADTKLDRVIKTSPHLYGETDGGTFMYSLSSEPGAWTVAQRGGGGVLAVGTPTASNHAATKDYVDNHSLNLPSGQGAVLQDASGNLSIKAVAGGEAKAYSIPERTYGGILIVGDPDPAQTQPTKQAVTVGYADANYVKKDTYPTSTTSGVIKLDHYYGFQLGQYGSAGVLQFIQADATAMNSKSQYRVITPNNFDLALTYASNSSTSGYFNIELVNGQTGRAYFAMPNTILRQINSGAIEIYEAFMNMGIDSYHVGIPCFTESSSYTGSLWYDGSEMVWAIAPNQIQTVTSIEFVPLN